MLSVEKSAKESSAVTSVVETVSETKVSDNTIRKIAHFCEFGALGLTMGLILLVKNRVKSFYLSYILFCGVFVAVIDESIQLISDGRGSQVQDVLRDSGGMLIGIAISCIIALIRKALAKSKRIEE